MPGKKADNRRVYPDANHQPRHKAKLRKQWALERQAESDKLTTQQKLDRLPPEPLCKKQRARLLALLAKPVKVVPEPVVAQGEPVAAAPSKEEKKARKYIKGQ